MCVSELREHYRTSLFLEVLFPGFVTLIAPRHGVDVWPQCPMEYELRKLLEGCWQDSKVVEAVGR